MAAQFLRQVPSRGRSWFVSEALSARLAERDRILSAACEAANADADLAAIGREFDGFDDGIGGTVEVIPQRGEIRCGVGSS